MVRRLNIFGLEFVFVFKYRYNSKRIDDFTIWKDWKLGLFFRRSKIVGANVSPRKWKNNLTIYVRI